MQNIVWKLVLIAAIVALCLLSIRYQGLRLGTDLRGGVSLVYKVTIPEEGGRDPQEILSQTITVLKDRVNPSGVLDISMQPLGRDRIEIVMPLPNKAVQGLAREYRAALNELLRRSEIRAADLDDALKRSAAPEELGGDSSSDRGVIVADLQLAYFQRSEARTALADGRSAGASEQEVRSLEFAVAEAEIAFEDLYSRILGMSLGEARLRRTLALPRTEQALKNPDGSPQLDPSGKAVKGPSQRESALLRIQSEFPDLAAALDATVARYDVYDEKRTGFDDPEDLIRLLRGAGVLEFRIAVSPTAPEGVDVQNARQELGEIGPDNTSSPITRWLPINELKQWYDNAQDLAFLEADPAGYFQQRDLTAGVFEGEHYLLLYTSRQKSLVHDDARPPWTITNSFPGADRLGRPAVNFQLDSAGGSQMSRLTSSHLKQPMAIVLDGEVFSAPTIQGLISASGQITGSFSADEIKYLVRVLAAGSLQARLSSDPIAINTIGPSIGQDNLRRGRDAFIFALIAVAAFMLVYYFFAGVVANVALFINGLIIFGVMMGIDGTFTLPGLAGIVLTVGMAVDANVLIYERIREEIFAGESDLRTCIRQGYRKALSTILDGNITNLIVCLVLFKTATTEVKGFALTLTIGICATLFTALFVTRQVFYLYTDLAKVRHLAMLPTVVPAIHRALEPAIDWISLRMFFWTASVLAVIGSVTLVSMRGVDMFDTEFRGGVSLTMRTAPLDANHDGEPDEMVENEPVRIMLRHTGSEDSVEVRLRRLGELARAEIDAGRGETAHRILAELVNASILTANETRTDAEGNVLAQAFQVKVSSPKGLDDDRTISRVIVDAIVGEFGDQLDATQPLSYKGSGVADPSDFIVPIAKDAKNPNRELGPYIGYPAATQRVSAFLGGAAIKLEDVNPPVAPEEVAKRIDRMRNQPDFVRYSGRTIEVFGLTPADSDDRSKGYVDLAVVVYDEYRSYLKIDTAVWFDEVARPEWVLLAAALQQPTSLEQVSTFSSAVAETMSAQAIVAVVLTLLGILVYIWVRFGSLRYSLAAIVALLHDVTIALGLLAFSSVIAGTAIGSALLIEPFRIDLGVVAALLTIIGYSLNDTIVILDRIRENRGKLPLPTAKIVNRSINQTVSRTLLTSVTTLVAVLIMYAQGGSGMRPFTFCLLCGLLVGTYSSIAIAAPLVFTGKASGPETAGA